jgi:hypothetical protein
MVRRAESWRDLRGNGSLLPHNERLKAGDDLLLLVSKVSRDQLEFTDGFLLATDQEAHMLHIHSQILGRVEMHLQVLAAIFASA